jgi:hypothetical protein
MKLTKANSLALVLLACGIGVSAGAQAADRFACARSLLSQPTLHGSSRYGPNTVTMFELAFAAGSSPSEYHAVQSDLELLKGRHGLK